MDERELEQARQLDALKEIIRAAQDAMSDLKTGNNVGAYEVAVIQHEVAKLRRES